MWYGRLTEAIRSDQLQAIGVIQEQHADRTLLFNQWKQLSMDVLVDPLNALDVEAVPIILLVDSSGIIRFRDPSPAEAEQFLRTQYPITESVETDRAESGAATSEDRAPADVPGQHWAVGDQLALRDQLDQAIDFYRTELVGDSAAARLHFRLGVALRMRFDRNAGHEQDLVDAMQAWTTARRLNPNQYIWRRRIQQYGPVMDKPYPFYSWVAQARREIQERGEQPVPLTVEPAGAELAEPRRLVQTHHSQADSPDPQDKLKRDTDDAVCIKTVVVPSTDAKQPAVRIHVMLTLRRDGDFLWNNEAEPLQLWVNSNEQLRPAAQLVELANPDAATSEERRVVEFDVTWPVDYAASDPMLRAYAVYNLCNKQTGLCTIRRQDFQIRWKSVDGSSRPLESGGQINDGD